MPWGVDLSVSVLLSAGIGFNIGRISAYLRFQEGSCFLSTIFGSFKAWFIFPYIVLRLSLFVLIGPGSVG
jgi:hypothetical protein